LTKHEFLGHHLGLGVEVGESRCVGQGLIATGDALAAHHHTVGRRVDESLHPCRLRSVDEVLGAADVDGEAALAGRRGTSAHQVDDRGGVDDGVDVRDRRRDVGLVGDVSHDGLEPVVRGEGRRRPVEGPDLVAPLQQLRHEVGADETGAAGHEHAAEFSGQR
jgi:hypothetical protein